MIDTVFGPRLPQPITMGPRAPTVNLDQSGHAMRIASASEEEGRGMSVNVICTTLWRENIQRDLTPKASAVDERSEGSGALRFLIS